MAGAIAEPRDRGGRQRPQDRLLRDPHRQDRRGHRAQGQGHQHPAAGDRRRHRRRRRRHGRHGDHRGQGRQRGGGGPPADLAHPRPAAGRGGRHLPGQGGQHHQVRCVRQHAARAATACCTSPSCRRWPAASGSSAVEDVLALGQPVEVRVDDIDPQGKVSLSLAGDAPRDRSSGAAAATAATGDEAGAIGRPASVRLDQTVVARARAAGAARPGRGRRSRTPSRPSWSPDLGDLGPARRPATAPRGRQTAATVAPQRSRGVDRSPPASDGPVSGRRSTIRTETCPAAPPGHRAMADVALGGIGFWVGTGSRDEPDELAGASHFLEHLLFKGTAERSPRPSPRRSTRWVGTATPSPPRSTRPSTSGCWPSTSPSGLDILVRHHVAPALRASDVEAERTVILDEILMHADEPADQAAEQWLAALFPGSPARPRHARARRRASGGR